MMQNNEQEQEEVIRWEELMPKTVLRVLLVEPDCSTRQILTALLRKCNYQVAPIADGLQAWEILKKRHNSIDLILTELDLPSISGYALLALIMEHDGCKNIPVVVTSSQDSISMVLNCMLKGAADYLIKPVRINELKNLWRHVWRRLSINDGQHAQNPATEQKKVKAAFEKNSATDHSGNNVSTSRKRNKLSENEGSVSVVRREVDDRSFTGLAPEHGSVGHTYQRCNTDSDILGPAEEFGCYREALDLIGSMKDPKSSLVQGPSNEKFGSLVTMPALELSLSTLHDSETAIEVDERHALNHSNTSAFSWCNSNKESQSCCSLSTSELMDITRIADSSPQPKSPDIIIGEKSTIGSRRVLDMGCWKGYATTFQPISSSLVGPGREPAAKSLKSAFHREDSPFLTSHSLHSDSGTVSSTVNDLRDSVDRYGYRSCNEFVDQKITVSGSASDLTEVNTDSPASALEKTIKVESCNTNFELGQFRHRSSLYSVEREAALAKFRLKRKGRCFDKKVRYQSRKNLAEQRPRVKGQFVHHVPIDQMVIEDIKLG